MSAKRCGEYGTIVSAASGADEVRATTFAIHDEAYRDGLADRAPRVRVNENGADWGEYCRGYVLGARDRSVRVGQVPECNPETPEEGWERGVR